MYLSLTPGLLGVRANALETIPLASRHGFGGIDIDLLADGDAIAAHGAAAFAAAMRAAGVRAGVARLLPVRTAAPDSEWLPAMESLPRLSRLARELGFTRTTAVVLPFHDQLDFEENAALHIARLRAAGDVLAAHGIRLGLEYVAPLTRRANQPHPFVHNLRGLLGVLDAIARPNIGLLLDAFHWHCAEETAADLQRLTASQVVAVHVNDAPRDTPREALVATARELPGATGVIDLAAFMRALRAIGYDGPLICEPMNRALEALPPDEALAATRAALGRLLQA